MEWGRSSGLLFAAVAIAVGGCVSGAPSGTLTASDAEIVFGTGKCDVVPKKQVIDYGQSYGQALEVTWIRPGVSKNVKFKLSKASDRTLFPKLEGKFPFLSRTKKSGKPAAQPPWTTNPDGTQSYTVVYTVEWEGMICDPEFCIRKAGGGCGI